MIRDNGPVAVGDSLLMHVNVDNDGEMMIEIKLERFFLGCSVLCATGELLG